MKKLVNISILVALSLLISCNTSTNRKETRAKGKILSPASRSEKNGWIYIHLEGAPAEIVYQHGYLLANEIIDLRNIMSMFYEKTTEKNWIRQALCLSAAIMTKMRQGVLPSTGHLFTLPALYRRKLLMAPLLLK